MAKVGIFMADGCEEIEGLTVVDLLRRAGIEITMISISNHREVTSSHKVTFMADQCKSEVDFNALDAVVLPGGIPGALNLAADETVNKVIREFAENGKLVAAICAAPGVVLGQAGLLNGKHAICFPGFEDKMTGAIVENTMVVRDGNIITGRSMAAAVDFGLEIIRYLAGEDAVNEVAGKIVYNK